MINAVSSLPSWEELAKESGIDIENMTFKPFSFNQLTALYESNNTFNLWEGAIRSGKTFLSIAWLIDKIHTLPKGSGMIMGQTPETIERNFLDDFMSILGEGSYHYVNGKYIDVYYRNSEGLLTSRRMYVVGVKNKDAIRRVRGSTLMIAYIDEATLMPRDVFDELVGRLSYKESIALLTTNPDSPFHWLLKDYVEHEEKAEDWSRHKFTIDDNKALSPDYVTRIKRQYAGIPSRYQRMILGRWVIAEGVIYQVFDKDTHVVKSAPSDWGAPRAYHVASDYGDQNATVFLLFAEYRVKGRSRFILEDEYYYSGRDSKISKTVTQFVKDFEAWLGERRVRDIIIDPSAKALIREFEDRGYIPTKAKNDVSTGIAEVGNFLYNERVLVHSRCKKTIEEFGVYIWDEKATARGEDAPLKENDHCMDAFRYFVMEQVA